MYVEPRDMACRLQLRTSFADEEVNMNVARHNNRRENPLPRPPADDDTNEPRRRAARSEERTV